MKKELKKFDIYGQLPKEFTEPTFSGALISIISTVAIIVLILNEYYAYISVT